MAKIRVQLEHDVEEELEQKKVAHMEAMRTALAETRRNALDTTTANQPVDRGQATSERFSPAGRDDLNSRPIDLPALLSGNALQRWKQAHPERYAELKADGFFDRVKKQEGKPTDDTG